MVGQPPWVWHDFKIRWELLWHSEPSAPKQGSRMRRLGIGDNWEPAAKQCRTNRERPVNLSTGRVRPQGARIPLKTIKLWCRNTANGWKRRQTEQFLPIVKDMKNQLSRGWVHKSLLIAKKMQNASRHLINVPSILPATWVQHAVKSMSTT